MYETDPSFRSEISLNQFANKIYEDPFYRMPLPKAAVNYAVFSSKWDIEDSNEDNILKIIHRSSGDTISLSFDTLKDKIEFVKNIYVSQPLKQIGTGIDLEKFANINIKPKQETYINSVLNKIENNLKGFESKFKIPPYKTSGKNQGIGNEIQLHSFLRFLRIDHLFNI